MTLLMNLWDLFCAIMWLLLITSPLTLVVVMLGMIICGKVDKLDAFLFKLGFGRGGDYTMSKSGEVHKSICKPSSGYDHGSRAHDSFAADHQWSYDIQHSPTYCQLPTNSSYDTIGPGSHHHH